MAKWLRNIRGAVLMGLAWAGVWAPIGLLIGLIVDSDGAMDEMWAAVGGYPGFLCGAVFFTVLGVSEGRLRFDELPLSRVCAKGSTSGVLVGMLPFVLGSIETGVLPVWLLGVLIIVSITLLSAVSAAGSLALAKWWRRKNSSTPVMT